MRILIVRPCPDILNIESYNCQQVGLAKALIKKGNTCDFVLFTDQNKNYEEDYISDGCKIHIYYLKSHQFLGNVFFDKEIKNIIEKYDVIHTEEYNQIGSMKLKKYAKGKMIIYHGPYASTFTRGYNIRAKISDFIYLFNRKYKNTICIAKSNLAKDFLISKGFKNVQTIGVGLDTSRFKKEISINPKIKELKENKKDLHYLLYIGKIEDRRNTIFLINLVEEISKEYNNIKLILVGKGDKEYLEKCKNLIKEKKLENKIVYIESMKQEELKDLYNIADIFLLPTKYEIYGMVLLEAMYFGVPTITTVNGGSSVLIKDGVNGFICEKNNIGEWKEHIKRIFDNEENSLKISENAQKTIRDSFTWDSLVDGFIEIYRKVEGSNNGKDK